MSNELILIKRCREIIIEHEDSVPFFYGDSVGVVTIGAGHAIKNFEKDIPTGLSWKKNGKNATENDIKEAYNAVNTFAKENFSSCTQQANMKKLTGDARAQHINKCMPTAKKYETLNDGLKLDDASIKKLLDKDLQLKLLELKEEFNRISKLFFNPPFKLFDEHPLPVQIALLDMAYNLGAKGLTGSSLGGAKNKIGYPHMLHAIREDKFDAAAEESHRPQVGTTQHPRNRLIFNLFMDADLELELLNNFKR